VTSTRAAVPDVFTGGRWRSSDETESTAADWYAQMRPFADAGAPIAAVMPSSTESVPLFAALTALPVVAIALPVDPRSWRTEPRLPDRTVVFLPPSLASLQDAVHAAGWRPVQLADAAHRAHGVDLPLLQSPGIVAFTSGSTSVPKAVFRTTAAIIAGACARLRRLGVPPGAGIVTSGTPSHAHGLTTLLTAMVQRGPLALLRPVDHRTAIATLALPQFGAWWASAQLADVLGRCALSGPPRVPPVCVISSAIPRLVFDRFQERFGVPMRQGYSSTETGPICVNYAAAADVRHDVVGEPLPTVAVRVGDHPDDPAPVGTVGRVWVRSHWQMTGYGYPPDVERPADVNGWWPLNDVARIDGHGRVALAGRLDDCIRTRDGRLVNLAIVADQLRDLDGVSDAAVVPLHDSAGATFGAIVECDGGTGLAQVRRQLADALASWSTPRQIIAVTALPRLPNGKLDRLACIAALEAVQP
jgi:acyl-coenzyme A synthetase/AMP-(fatty) acid ligase